MRRALGQRPLLLPPSAQLRQLKTALVHSCGPRMTGQALLTSTLTEAGVDLEMRCGACRLWEDAQFRLWDLDLDLQQQVEQLASELPRWRHEMTPRETFEAHLTEALQRVNATVDPVALETCRHFHHRVRATIYWAVRHDRTGYVLQLAEAKPGVLALIAHTAPFELSAALPSNPLPNIPIWRDVVAGRPLVGILAEVARRLHHPEEDRARLRWFANRADRGCAPEDVLRVSQIPSVPQSDLPREPRDRARWIGVLADLPLYDSPRDASVVRYASARFGDLGAIDRVQLDRVVSYVRNSGRRPSRAKPVAQLLVEMEAYFEEWAENHSVESVLAMLEKENADVPAPPYPACESEHLRITPITTLRELYDEGQAMRHCIFSYYDLVIAGQVAIYHVEAFGEASTLLLRREEAHWLLEEQGGVLNEPPSAEALAAVERWLEDARAEREPDHALVDQLAG